MNVREGTTILLSLEVSKNYLDLLDNCLLLVKSSQKALVMFNEWTLL